MQSVSATSPLAPADPSRALAVVVALVASLGFIAYVAIADDAFDPLVTMFREHQWSMLIVRPTVLWGGMASLMLLVRSALWVRYRPDAPVDAATAPRLTVVIPAYNEGPMVLQAIDSVASAEYPRDRLQIFAIDDGSTDSTWEHIELGAARHPGLVTPLRMPKNGGKRAALAEGFRRATGRSS